MYTSKPILPLLDPPTVWPSQSSPLSTDFMSLQPLSSPIHLESRMTPPSATSPSHPRRRLKSNSHHTNRPRASPRRNFRVNAPDHAFDQLPWISTLQTAPDLTNPWDIADLSLIPDLDSADLPSGLGPVRRRKSSLRSNPMDVSPTPESLPIRDTSPLLSVPTPRSHFIPSRVLFHNLMPVAWD